MYIVNRDNCPGHQVMGRPLCYCRYQCKWLFPLGKSQRVWCSFCPRRKLDCSVSMKCRLTFYCEEYSVSLSKVFILWHGSPIILMVISYWWMTALFFQGFTPRATDFPASLLHVLLHWFPLIHYHYYLGFLHSSCVTWRACSILWFFFTNFSLKYSHALPRAQEFGDSDFCNSSPL